MAIDYRTNDGRCQHHCNHVVTEPDDIYHFLDELGERCPNTELKDFHIYTRKNPTHGYLYRACDKCIHEMLDDINAQLDRGETPFVRISIP